eukprot:scaffold7376_cov592-Prasinococcus_capsulatus_cf.AAC.1
MRPCRWASRLGAKSSLGPEREGRHGSSRTCEERHPPWGAVGPGGGAPLPPGGPGGVPPGRGGRPRGPPEAWLSPLPPRPAWLRAGPPSGSGPSARLATLGGEGAPQPGMALGMSVGPQPVCAWRGLLEVSIH